MIIYGKEVLTNRVLPPSIDGLLPAQRRLLETARKISLSPSNNMKKAASLVGSTLDLHPHGDAALYDVLVNCTAPWKNNAPLFVAQGNVGSEGGDPAASSRYLEVKMSHVGHLFLKYRSVVNEVISENKQDYEPEFLVAPFPFIVNGNNGIGYGFACSILPHNPNEVLDLLAKFLDNPDITETELYNNFYPDFPNGGTIVNKHQISTIYQKGEGTVIVQGSYNIDARENTIVFTSIPYQTTSEQIQSKISDNRKIFEELVADVKDLSSKKTGFKLKIKMKKGIDAEYLINLLFKYTPLRKSCSWNPTYISSKGVQDKKSLKHIISEFVTDKRNIVERYLINKVNDLTNKIHIDKGFLMLQDPKKLDQFIKIVRSSKTDEEIYEQCFTILKLTNNQTESILSKRINALSAINFKKLADSIAAMEVEIKEIKFDQGSIDEIIFDDFVEALEKTGLNKVKRKTTVTDLNLSKRDEDLIKEETKVIVITDDNKVALTDISIPSQNKSGKGRKIDKLIIDAFEVSTKDDIGLFTNSGKIIKTKAYKIPSSYTSLSSFASSGTDKVISLQPLTSTKTHYFIVTKQGKGKVIEKSDIYNSARSELIISKLNDGDEIKSVIPANLEDFILVVYSNKKIAKYRVSDVTILQRTTYGQQISFSQEAIIDVKIMSPESKILSITKSGLGKVTDNSSIQPKGLKSQGVIFNSDPIAMIETFDVEKAKNYSIFITTKLKKQIKIPLDQIRELKSTNARGVKVITLDTDDLVANAIIISSINE
jgi:DNA gyrase subunit A